MIPKVPSDPISICLRSKPRLSFLSGTRPEKISPSASTASIPSTCARIVPWRRTCVPPALVEMRPPTVAEPLPPSVRGKRKPCSSAVSCSVWSTTPASQVICCAATSKSRIASIRRSESNMLVPLSSGVAPPDMPLFPPCGTIGIRCAAHSVTNRASSSVEAGEARPTALPVYRPRQSVSQGSTSSGSQVNPRGPRMSAAAARKVSVTVICSILAINGRANATTCQSGQNN